MEINEVLENKSDKGKEEKRRGIKRKAAKENKNEDKEEYKDGQDKFFIDVTKDQEAKEMVGKLLAEANNKQFGRTIILKDLVLMALPKLTSKDIEQIQNTTLTHLEKVKKQCFEYNHKNNTNFELGEYLVTVKNILKEGKDGK
jgi:23S rRNA A1618 N6-methylase RlmF